MKQKVIAIIFIVLVVLLAFTMLSGKKEIKQPVLTEQEQTALNVKQAKREKMIQKLINEGIFQKAETPGNLPHLWVKPAFYALDYDSKQTFVNVVWAYYITADPKYEIVMLYDSRTGKHVGTYSKRGLDME